jgi:hypothetical protein
VVHSNPARLKAEVLSQTLSQVDPPFWFLANPVWSWSLVNLEQEMSFRKDCHHTNFGCSWSQYYLGRLDDRYEICKMCSRGVVNPNQQSRSLPGFGCRESDVVDQTSETPES